VAFVLAAKLGREARRENVIACVASARLRESGEIETGSRRSRFLLPARGEKDRMRGRCRDSELTGSVLVVRR
jgi:hypothetical protein